MFNGWTCYFTFQENVVRLVLRKTCTDIFHENCICSHLYNYLYLMIEVQCKQLDILIFKKKKKMVLKI